MGSVSPLPRGADPSSAPGAAYFLSRFQAHLTRSPPLVASRDSIPVYGDRRVPVLFIFTGSVTYPLPLLLPLEDPY